jgi:hypothetical protein
MLHGADRPEHISSFRRKNLFCSHERRCLESFLLIELAAKSKVNPRDPPRQGGSWEPVEAIPPGKIDQAPGNRSRLPGMKPEARQVPESNSPV